MALLKTHQTKMRSLPLNTHQCPWNRPLFMDIMPWFGRLQWATLSGQSPIGYRDFLLLTCCKIARDVLTALTCQEKACSKVALSVVVLEILLFKEALCLHLQQHLFTNKAGVKVQMYLTSSEQNDNVEAVGRVGSKFLSCQSACTAIQWE